jgi:hypothetical protein
MRPSSPLSYISPHAAVQVLYTHRYFILHGLVEGASCLLPLSTTHGGGCPLTFAILQGILSVFWIRSSVGWSFSGKTAAQRNNEHQHTLLYSEGQSNLF